jgi:outer membrane receptor protein involved in Fe transport
MKPQNQTIHPLRWLLAPSCVLFSVASLPAQLASGPGAAPPPGAKPPEEVVQMSPFEVVEDSRGYFASNTLSGTRLNAKIEDLGASITVVTKQQLLDTAALDINDVFLFEASTEGTGQFTDQSVDFQGRVIDNVQASPMTSNRVRGLAAANVTTGGFSSTSRIPFDSYNLESVEISRGPNSSLAGLGDAGGTVNLNQARANLNRESSQFTLRGDDWGGFRSAVDLNRPLWANKLAVRVSAVYDSKGFRRKPSADISRRQYGAFAFKPFAGTTLNGSFESFHQYRRTPNASTPVDMVTEWLNSGRPTWDPVTFTAKINGVSVGTFPQTNENSTLPRGLGRDAFFDNMPSLFIDGGQVVLFMVNRLQASGLPTTANFTHNIRLMTSYTDIGRYRNTGSGSIYPLDSLVGVSNKAVYDYSTINAVATNWNRDKAELYNLRIDQRLFDTPRHRAFAQVAWRLEDSDNYNHNLLNETTNIYIDVNERLLDGSPNPFFLRPYVNEIQRTAQSRPEYNDNARAQLSYELDLRKHPSGWLAALGRHQALGYYETRNVTTGSFGYREVVTNDLPWINSANRYASAHATLTDRFYIGDNQGFNVDYAPPLSQLPSDTYNLRYATNVATNPPTFTTIPVQINGQAFGGATRSRTEVVTRGAALQSFFWQDRMVTTFGVRQDEQRNRNTAGAAIDPATGFGTDTNLTTWQSWTYRDGKTKTYQGVVRPFLGWKGLAAKREQGGAAGLGADLLAGLSFHYNRADSFRPAAPGVNLFGEALPNPNGVGKDYGFSVHMLDGRLVARVNWYRTEQTGARLQGQFTQPVTIVRNIEVGTANSLETFARNVIMPRPSMANATEAQIQSAIYDFVKLPPGFYDLIRAPNNVTDVNNQLSKGKEIELNYNPSRNWSFKLTAAQTKAIDLSLIEATQRFIDQRMPVWTTVRNDEGQLWWTQVTPANAAQYNAQVAGNLRIMRSNLGKPRTQVKEWTWNSIATYRFTTGRLNGLNVSSVIRWADKSSIGFHGIRDPDGVYRQLDPNRPVYDPSRASYDFMANYNLRMFSGKVRTRVQVNVRDAFANRGLRATSFNPEGYPATFRILDGRQIILTTTFDL